MRRKKIKKLSETELNSLKVKKSQTLNCKKCGRTVENVSINAESVLCHVCTSLLVPIEEKHQRVSSGFPRGWKMYGLFVHQDGRVFRKGVEYPEERGTLPPTDLNEIKRKYLENKKLRKEKKEKKEIKLAKLYEKKKMLKKKMKKEKEKNLG
jgi:hypothetical protein